MLREKVIIKGKMGLDARPAAFFLKEANKFKSDIILIKDSNEYNAKSILSILSIGAIDGDEVEIVVDGEDEKEAMKLLIQFFDKKLEDNIGK